MNLSLLKQLVSYYLNVNNQVSSALWYESRAFDRTNHNMVAKKY